MTASRFVLDEGPRPATRFLVGKLFRRRIHEIARRARQGAPKTAIHRQLCAADGVDDYAGGIRRIPDLQPHLGAQWYAAERGAFETDVGKFAIRKPRNMVTGAYVNIIRFQGNVELAGNGLRLGYLF